MSGDLCLFYFANPASPGNDGMNAMLAEYESKGVSRISTVVAWF